MNKHNFPSLSTDLFSKHLFNHNLSEIHYFISISKYPWDLTVATSYDFIKCFCHFVELMLGHRHRIFKEDQVMGVQNNDPVIVVFVK